RAREWAWPRGAALLENDAVLDLDLRAGRHRLDLRHGHPVARFDDTRRGELVVQLPQHLAGHGMDDGDPVTPQADDRARLHAVHRREIDHDAADIHVDDEATLGWL